MSMEVWVCEGIGLRSSAIYPHLDMNKCCMEIQKQLSGVEISRNRFDLDDFLCCDPYCGLGDFLASLDDTNTMTYGDNGNGETFFYYTRCYPWEQLWNEPKSIDDVHQRIIRAVSKVCNLSPDEIDKLIEDDIYEEGYG